MGESERSGVRYLEVLARLLVALALTLGLTGCGYDGWIRYPCQEFENWHTPECSRPECDVTGQCSEDLVGKSIYEQTTPNE